MIHECKLQKLWPINDCFYFKSGLVLIMIGATRVPTGYTNIYIYEEKLTLFVYSFFLLLNLLGYFNYFVSINVVCANNNDVKSPIN